MHALHSSSQRARTGPDPELGSWSNAKNRGLGRQSKRAVSVGKHPETGLTSTNLKHVVRVILEGGEPTRQVINLEHLMPTAQKAVKRRRRPKSATPSHPPLPRLLVKKRQACEMLDMSPATIDRWIAAGHLEKVVFGTRHVRVTMKSIEAMLAGAPRS